MTETANPVPAADTAEPAAQTGSPVADEGATRGNENQDAAKARRQIAKLERERDEALAKANEFAEAQKTEAEKEREKAIQEATSKVKAEYEATIKRERLRAAVLVELSSKVGVDAARKLVPAVLADEDLDEDSVPAAVNSLVETLNVKVIGPGGQGGSPTGGTSLGPNPWKDETFNLTAQLEMMESDPVKAQRLAAQAGVKI